MAGSLWKLTENFLIMNQPLDNWLLSNQSREGTMKSIKFTPAHALSIYQLFKARSTNSLSIIRQRRNYHNATTAALVSTLNDDNDDNDDGDENNILQLQHFDDSDEMQYILYINGIEQKSQSDIELSKIEIPISTPETEIESTNTPRELNQKQFITLEDIITSTEQQESYNNFNNQSNSIFPKRSHSTDGVTSLAVLRRPSTTSSFKGDHSVSPLKHSEDSNSSITAKHEQLSQAASTVATSVGNSITSITSPEKEKKCKEVSSSRVKKFHRHFSQVSKDEKLINYFSCALVSDILLQGHLYITDKHFAFYSNVFGYVTKVIIPTSSVTKISKEKTAKIIPNAVGVATADERHVFGSFISREAAYRLMCSVCPNPLAPIGLIPKDLNNIEISEEYSIEDDSSCSVSGNESPAQVIENCFNTNISDKITTTTTTVKAVHINPSQTLLRRNVGNNSSNLSANITSSKQRHSDIPYNAKTSVSSNALNSTQRDIRLSAPATANIYFSESNLSPIKYTKNNNCKSNKIRSSLTLSKTTCSTSAVTSTSTTSSSQHFDVTFMRDPLSMGTSGPSTTSTTPSRPARIINKTDNKVQGVVQSFCSCVTSLLLRIKFPAELHVVYIGAALTLLLTIFTIFLLYRILDIEAKTSLYHRSPNEFNWHFANDDDIFVEALRFQKVLHHKSNVEAESILKTNLERIAKVRRSLEALSTLISERRSSFDYTHPVKQHDKTAN